LATATKLAAAASQYVLFFLASLFRIAFINLLRVGRGLLLLLCCPCVVVVEEEREDIAPYKQLLLFQHEVDFAFRSRS
jgi:hypothetical protein